MWRSCLLFACTVSLASLALAEPVQVHGDTAYLPLRHVAQWLGARVDYTPRPRTITVTRGETVLTLTGADKATLNGAPLALSRPVIAGAVTYVSWKLFVDAFGATVTGDLDAGYVTVTPPQSTRQLVLYLPVRFDPNNRASWTSQTAPFRDAIHAGNLDSLQRLLDEKPALINYPDDQYFAPLHQAVLAKQAAVVDLLLARSANPACAVDSPWTTYHFKDGETQQTLALGYATPLHCAAALGETGLVETLLNAGVPLNPRTYMGETPLALAVGRGNQPVTELLLARGAQVNAGDTPPLLIAAVQNQLVLADLLRKHGADLQARGIDRQTALHLAVNSHHPEMAEFLLTQGAKPDAVDEGGRTPLYYAHNKVMAELLVTYGAVVNMADRFGQTPLHLVDQDVEQAQYLLEHGASVHARDKQQRTPLFTAETPEMVRLLARYGAEANARDTSGQTPLFQCQDAELAQALLDVGARVDLRDKDGNTPLHSYAREVYSGPAVELLLASGADPNAVNQHGETPLHLAAPIYEITYEEPDNTYRPVTEILLEHGAAVNARANNGDTPLHRVRFKKIADVLLAHGADVTLKNNAGDLPLHTLCASENVDTNAILALVAKGADINARNAAGNTPLHLAICSHYGNVQLAQALLDHGADPNSKNAAGATPLHLTFPVEQGGSNNEEIARRLLAKGADPNARDRDGRTPLHRLILSRTAQAYTVQNFLKHGASITLKDNAGLTPVDYAQKQKGDWLVKALRGEVAQ